MDEELKKALAALSSTLNEASDNQMARLQEFGDRIDAIELAAQRPALATNRPEFKAFEAFIRGGKESLTDAYRDSLIVSDDQKGGYITAPREIEAGIVKTLNQWSPLRPYATVRTISTPGVSMARQTQAPEAHWVGETEQRSETTMSYGRLDIPVHTAAVYVDVSLELLEDSAYDIMGEITVEFGKAFGKLEALSHISGDGVKKPLGILNTDGVENIASGAATDFTIDGLMDLYYGVPEAYATNGTWLANRASQGKIRKKKSGDGDYIWTDSIVTGQPPALMARPIAENVHMPNVAAGTRPILFGDLSWFRIYDRIGLSIMRDDFTKAGTGEVRFWGRRRTGAGLVMPEAVKTLFIGESV